MTFVSERLGLIIDNSFSSVGPNINGPCCIKAPSWLKNPIGRYLLYFSSHSGSHVRLCFTDDITKSWSLYRFGVLNLDSYVDAYDHIASPDIYIDNVNKRLIMYFHARSHIHGRQQWSFAATSTDGVSFYPLVDFPLAPFYLKVFAYNNSVYGLTKGGNLWVSKDGISTFKPLGNPFAPRLSNDLWHNDNGCIRHVGVLRRDNLLHVAFSRIGDSPEHILYSQLDISSSDPHEWMPTTNSSLLFPETSYEGADLPLSPSKSGPCLSDENALRDPHLLLDDNIIYLFYSVRGESGIAVAKVELPVF